MLSRRAVLCALAVILVGSGLSASTWPSFRGLNATGIGSGTPPVSWNVSDGTNIAWKAQVPGLGHSSPIVAGDLVIVTTAVAVDGANAPVTLGNSSVAGIGSASDTGVHEWRIYAFDRRTGRERWQHVAHRGQPRLKRHVKASHASATPATDGKVIVALMGTEGMFCYSVDGRLLWRKDLGVMDVGLVDDPTYQWGPASSPVIAGGRIVVQNDRHSGSWLASFDLATGDEQWRVPREEMPSWATPLVVTRGGRSIVITNSPRRVAAYDLATGTPLWHLSDGTQVKVPSPVVSGNLAIITGGYAPGTRPTFAIPLDATGEVTPARLAWQIDRGSPYTTTPIVYEGVLSMVTDAGVLSAYDAATGARLYQERVGPGAGGFSASPVAAAGRLYFASEDGDIHVVRAGRTFERLATNPFGEMLLATPAISNDLLIVRTRSQLVAIGRP